MKVYESTDASDKSEITPDGHCGIGTETIIP
jgi:hypothetical protein